MRGSALSTIPICQKVKSNADLVEKIVRIARELRREIAPRDEGRKILQHLPAKEK